MNRILAQMLQPDKEKAEEKTSDTIFKAMVLKDLLAASESIVTVLNFGVQKQFKKMKQDLVNFADSRCSPGSDVTSTALHSNGRERESISKCKAEGLWQETAKPGRLPPATSARSRDTSRRTAEVARLIELGRSKAARSSVLEASSSPVMWTHRISLWTLSATG